MSDGDDGELCLCGRPLHYQNALSEVAMRNVIDRHGADVVVGTADGMWRVPRHFIALHGVNANDLPALARRYGFVRVMPN